MNDAFPGEISIHPWRPAAWVRAEGPDAFNFLQGQFTNDLRDLPAGGGVYGLWLDHKGKVQGDSFVLPAGPQGYWLATYSWPAAALRGWLEQRLVADEVVLEDHTADVRAVCLLGTGTGQWILSQDRPGWRFPGRRSGGENWEWAFPAADLAGARSLLGSAAELSADEIERLRIEARLPSVPADLGPGDLPQEGGLEAFVSPSKGCFTGQEVMSRLRTRGSLRRRIFGVQGAGAAPALPAPLFRGDRRAGELRTAVPRGAEGFAGLALLTVSLAGPDPLAIGAPQAPITCRAT